MNSTLLSIPNRWRGIFSSLIIFVLALSVTELRAQNVTISGNIVSEESKEPLPGVNVVLKGTNSGTITDANGEFTLSAPPNSTLLISSIGFLPQEIAINSRSVVSLSLKADVRQLDEIVVVGYGTVSRKDLTGSVSKVDPLETKTIQAGSFDAQLQGKVSGVQISSSTGVPGEAVNVRVRGATSINADNDPLYIVDGVFINSNSLQQINTGGKATSPIADLNPADIESIEVLKDAGATALYGSRGANGVVIITTKRGGFNQKPQISFNASQGWAKAPKLWDLTTGPQHAELVNEWWVNVGNPAASRPFRPASEVVAGQPGRGTPEEQQTYDRLSELFRTARLQSYALSLTGGNNNTRYYIAGGYDDQQAIIKPINFNRTSFKVNLDQQVNDKVLVSTSNSFTRTYRDQGRAGDGPQGGLLQAALHTPTYLSPLNETGQPVGRAGFDNLTSLIDNYNVHTTSLRYIGNVFVEAEILPNLKFKSSWGADYNNYNESEYWNTFLLLGAQGGYATSGITQYTSLLNEQTLTWNQTLGSNHHLRVLVGNTLQRDVQSRTYAEGRGFPNNSYTQISSASTSTSSQSWSKNTLASFFSSIGYSFSEKYLLDLSLRADGSSRFGNANKWGYFPSVGAAWRIKEEGFLKEVNVISNLKLRASYGLIGNQNGIGNFAAQGLWNGGNGYQGNPGTAPLQLANPDLKWERTKQFNVGVDVGLFSNKLNLEFNVYDKYTTDGLLQITLPGTSGFSTYWSNAAEISNKGFELGITSNNINRGDFSWTTSFNISRNVNNIEKLATPLKYGSRDLILQQEGTPLYSFWVYKQLYVDEQTGNAVYEDVNGDGKTTVADRQLSGSIWPDFFGGLTNNFAYKGFDLSVFFSYSYGNEVYNHNRFFGEGGGARDAARITLASNLERWQKPGDVTNVPRIDGINVNNYLDGGSRWQEDGSFLRLRSLTLGYTVAPQVLSKFRLRTLRAYVSGTNLWLLTNYTGLDPESAASSDQNQQGIDLGTPPQPRSIQVGINIGL
jgi:TonB-linked SusC/RagA family outer membrane protein